MIPINNASKYHRTRCIFKITSNAQHGNEAIKNIMLNRYKNLSKFHWISKIYLTCHVMKNDRYLCLQVT